MTFPADLDMGCLTERDWSAFMGCGVFNVIHSDVLETPTSRVKIWKRRGIGRQPKRKVKQGKAVSRIYLLGGHTLVANYAGIEMIKRVCHAL